MAELKASDSIELKDGRGGDAPADDDVTVPDRALETKHRRLVSRWNREDLVDPVLVRFRTGPRRGR